jgi:hypothetical protein
MDRSLRYGATSLSDDDAVNSSFSFSRSTWMVSLSWNSSLKILTTSHLSDDHHPIMATPRSPLRATLFFFTVWLFGRHGLPLFISSFDFFGCVRIARDQRTLFIRHDVTVGADDRTPHQAAIRGVHSQNVE